jgi:6-phosphogluconate dehydrogenase
VHIGLIGLGKMGFNMRERLRKGGIDVTGFDRIPEITDVPSVDALIAAVPVPRIIWVMVPAGEITDVVIAELGSKLDAGDLVIDGGNSRFTEDQKHGAELTEKGIRFADCGVSGGVWGLQNGYGLMAGGDAADIERALPVFDALRPEGERADSFVHVGGIGAGHYAKMVHNGIEYGLMQAYAEGYELLAAKDIITDLPGTFRAWQKGTVVRSWLLDLMVKALDEDPGLASIDDYVEDSGEGRWTV